MAITNAVMEYGQKLIKGMKGKEFRNGVVYGVKETMSRMAPYGGKLMHSSDPNARKIGSEILHICKKAKKLK